MPYNIMQYPSDNKWNFPGTKYAGPYDTEEMAMNVLSNASTVNGSIFVVEEVSSSGGAKKYRKIYIGPRGGKYIIKKGKRVYL